MELYETTASNEIHAVLQVVPVYANVTHILNQVNVFKVIPESLDQIDKQISFSLLSSQQNFSCAPLKKCQISGKCEKAPLRVFAGIVWRHIIPSKK